MNQKKNNLRRKIAFISLLFFIVSSSLQAQWTVRALGMGRAYTAVARGVHSVNWNPANLGLPDNPPFTFSIVSASAAVSNNGFTKGDVYQYEGKYWDQNMKEDILSKIPDNGLSLNAAASVRALSFSIKHFAMTFDGDGDGYARLDKTVFNLLLKGNEVGQTYTFNDVDGHGVGVGSLSFSWGQPFDMDFAEAFSMGATLRFTMGIYKAKVENVTSSLQVSDYGMDIRSEYLAKYAEGGLGWSLDIGAAAQKDEHWTFGFGLMNLIGTIPWRDNAKMVYGTVQGAEVAIEEFSRDDKEERSSVQDTSWTQDTMGFSEKMPTSMHLGAAYAEGNYLISMDYIQGFRRGVYVSTTPNVAFGTEWAGVGWLPLRLGLSLGGKLGVATSCGFGLRLGAFSMDVGWMSRGFLFPNTSKGGVLGLEIGLNL